MQKKQTFLMEGGYIIVKKNGKWVYINKDGKTTISFEFDFIGIGQIGQYKVPIFNQKKKGIYKRKLNRIKLNN